MKIPNNVIIIEVKNGCVCNVFVNGDQSVLVVDHDSICEPQWVGSDSPLQMENLSNQDSLSKIVKRKLKTLFKLPI